MHSQYNNLTRMQKILQSILCIFFIGLLLCSCSNTSSFTSSDISLWVVTEETVSDGMNYQLNSIAEKFQTAYPNVSINIDIIPNDSTRETYLNTLRDSISSGNGPDVFLLPTSNVLTLEHPQKYTYVQIDPLFPDVNIAMRKNTFADISSFYNTDQELNAEALSDTVMNAGVLNDARYVLPLRFNIPIAYVADDYIQEKGYSITALHSGIESWMNYVISQNDHELACGAEYISLSIFPNLYDYSCKRVTITEEKLEEFLYSYYQVLNLIGDETSHRNQLTLSLYGYGISKQFPVHIDMLQNAMSHSAIALSEGTELSMYPVRNIEGDTVASVTYYGAVGSTCPTPEIAYQFLREFLLEDPQWELSRPETSAGQYPPLIENSWPVRTKGSVKPLWENYLNNSLKLRGASSSLYSLKKISMDDSSIPILNEEIDIAIFPIYSSASNVFSEVNAYNTQIYSESNEAEIKKLASKFIQNLRNDYIIWEGL